MKLNERNLLETIKINQGGTNQMTRNKRANRKSQILELVGSTIFVFLVVMLMISYLMFL